MREKKVFIIKDHKTYVHSEEAWHKFHGRKEDAVLFIIIPEGDPNNVEITLKAIVDEHKWEEIIWFYSKSNFMPRSLKEKLRRNKILQTTYFYREFIYNYLDVIKLNKLARKYTNVRLVISGHRNLQEHLAKKLNPEVLYILDSGNFLDKVSNNGYIDYTQLSKYKSTRLNRILFRLTGLKIFDRKKTKIFTLLDSTKVGKHQLELNTQEYKKSKIRSKLKGDDIFFISSPVYTLSKKLSIDDYIDYLKHIIQSLQLDSSRLVYIPNPIRETEKDVMKIIREISCSADDRPIPIEIKIANAEKLPKLCISPYSTALINIEKIAEDRINYIFAWHHEFSCFEKLLNLRKNFLEIEGKNIPIIDMQNAPSLFKIPVDIQQGKPLYKNIIEWSQTS